MKRKKTNKKAFVSMFAVYFSAIVVSVLTAIYVLLVKQIEIMNLDTTSFQSLYMADSAFECALYKEQNASSSNSVFLPTYSTSFGSCATAGDAQWQSVPTPSAGRVNSILQVGMTTDSGDFCAIVKVGKQVTAVLNKPLTLENGATFTVTSIELPASNCRDCMNVVNFTVKRNAQTSSGSFKEGGFAGLVQNTSEVLGTTFSLVSTHSNQIVFIYSP